MSLRSVTLLCFCFNFAPFLVSSTETTGSAPALLWSPERSMSSLLGSDALDGVNSQTLYEKFLDPLMKTSAENGVIFLQNKLDIDDFTKYADVYSLDSDGGAFKNIKSMMDEHFSLELPHVEDPFEAVKKLKESFDGDLHSVKSAADVEKLSLGPERKFLLVVELRPSPQTVDDQSAIAENDATVGAICHHLHKRGIKYTAMFTGQPASLIQADSVESHSGRHLLATAEDDKRHFFNISGQMYAVLESVSVHVQISPKEQINLNFTDFDDSSASNSSIANDTAQFVLTLDGSADSANYAVEIVIDAYTKQDRWTISRVSFSINGPGGGNFNGSLSNTTLRTGDIDLVVPILYSYHCSSMKMYVDSVRNKDLASFKGTYVILGGFQLQPFNIQGKAFFNAQDCVGFFTRGIWMGIFPSLILLGILLFGIMMVLNLSTPDRFDDPKGKTIVVAQADE